MAFLRDPRAELKKLGIRLPSSCRIETVMQNHDWLAGHTDGLAREGRISVFFRGEGDRESFYRVTVFASKAGTELPSRELLHSSDEEEKPHRRISQRARDRLDATRRSMMASPLHLAAHRWIAPLLVKGPTTKSPDEAHRIFVGIKDVVARALLRSQELKDARDGVAALIQRRFHPAYTLVFRTQRASSATMQGSFAGAMYAKSLWMLQTSGWHFDDILKDVEQHLVNSASTLRTLSGAMSAVDPDFIAHTIVEITLLRREDAVLDARLTEAERLFDSHHKAHPQRCTRFHAPSKGLEHFAPKNAHEWWYLPGLIAFAIGIWPEATQSASQGAAK